MGSWLLYGLGAETRQPARLHRADVAGRDAAAAGLRPAVVGGLSAEPFQGIQFQSKGDAVHYVGNPDGVDARARSGR